MRLTKETLVTDPLPLEDGQEWQSDRRIPGGAYVLKEEAEAKLDAANKRAEELDRIVKSFAEDDGPNWKARAESAEAERDEAISEYQRDMAEAGESWSKEVVRADADEAQAALDDLESELDDADYALGNAKAERETRR